MLSSRLVVFCYKFLFVNVKRKKCIHFRCDEGLCSRRPGEELENVRRLKMVIAFKMLSSGSREIVPHALQLLPSSKVSILFYPIPQ